MDDSVNKIMAGLTFNITGALAQFELLEKAALESATKIQATMASGGTAGNTEAAAARATKTTALQQAKIEATLKESAAKQTAILAESAAKQETIVATSANAQVLAREKADAAVILSATKADAQMAVINSRTGTNLARTAAIAEQSAAQVSLIQAREAKIQATVATSEAKMIVITAKGEAEISAIRAKEALTREKIVAAEAATELATIRAQMAQEKILYMQSREAAFTDKTGYGALLARRMSWLVSGGLVMGGLAGLAGTISTISEVEKGMTTIARVTEDATFNFKGMRDELQQLGVTYGDTWADVSDIAIKWAQAGYDMSETTELTKASLLALNTAELTSEQATSGMIAIMAQWGLTSEELLPTIDKINKVADDFAITSTDLVSGLTRSSGAAKVLGLTMNETIAILTTMREATGRTGKEVGNALNSILSFMQRPTAIKAFETEGIQVFADEARTQFRNVIEIFDEMAARWPTMSEASMNSFADQAEAAGLYSEEMAGLVGLEEQYTDIQQRDLSQAAAGIYRRNYLLALLQNWSKVDEVLISQENSLGYSMKENERTMQTLAKQVEVLKASAEQLAVALGDSGLLNEITGLVEGTTDVVQWFANLDDSAQTLILTVLEVTAAVKLLGMAFKGLGLASLGAGVGKFAEMAKGITSVASAAALAGTAVKGLGKVIAGALGGPVGIYAVVIGSAIGFIARETHKASEELASNAVMASSLASEYDAVSTRLSGMTKGTDEYNQAAKELSTLKGNIADALPGVVDGWDKESGSMIINRDAMQDLIEAGEELKKSKQENADALDDEIARLQEERKVHESNAQEYESSQGVLEDLAKRREELTEVLAKQKKGSEEARATEDALGETEKLIANIAQEAGLKRNATVDAILKKLYDLKVGEMDGVLNTQQTERDKVAAVKDGALKRLDIIQQEINSYKSPENWGFAQAAGNFFKTINPLNMKNYDPKNSKTVKNLNLENLETVKGQAVREANKAKAAVTEMDKRINETRNSINAINANAIIGNTPPAPNGSPTGSPSGSGSTPSYSEPFKQYIQELERDLPTVDNAIYEHTAALELLSTKEAMLKDQMGEGFPTLEQQKQVYSGLTDVMQQHAMTQDDLHATADDYRVSMIEVNALIAQEDAKLKAGTITKQQHRESVDILLGKYNELSKSVDGMGLSWWKEEQAEIQAKNAIKKAEEGFYDQAYQDAMGLMNHEVAMGRMSAEEQISYLEQVRDAHEWNTDRRWELEENLYSKMKSQMDDYVDDIDDAYKGMQDDIKDRTDSIVAGLQAQIDALDDEGTAADRESATVSHNEKIAQLQKDRLYEELRTGSEHRAKVIEIDQQIADENRNFQETQDDWVRDDNKESLQDQIQDAKDAGQTELDALQTKYDKAKSITDTSMSKIISSINAQGDNWNTAGKSLIDSLIAGLKTGDFSEVLNQIASVSGTSSGQAGALQGAVDTITKNVAIAPIASIGPSQYTNENGRTYMSSQSLAGLLGMTATWDQASGKVIIGGKSFTPHSNISGRTTLGINEVATALGFAVKWEDPNVKIYPKAHIGAYVERDGLAELKHDERVLSPNLTVSFDRLASIIGKTPDVSSRITGGGSDSFDRAADRIISAIERKAGAKIDRLVHIDNYNPDVVDVNILAREMQREIERVG